MTRDSGQLGYMVPEAEARPRPSQDDGYPDDWPQVATDLKAAMGGRCEVCGHKSTAATPSVITRALLETDR